MGYNIFIFNFVFFPLIFISVENLNKVLCE